MHFIRPLLTLALLFRHKGLRTAGHKLVINLAVSNSIMHSKSWVIIVNGYSGGPLLGEWGKLRRHVCCLELHIEVGFHFIKAAFPMEDWELWLACSKSGPSHA